MQEECTFRVTLRDFSATDLKTRHRFKEQFKVYTLFDDIKHKSERQTIGGGDIAWTWSTTFEYSIYSWRFLDEKLFKVELKCQHDKKVSLGHLSIDLYTLATGPAEHNLPLIDFEGKNVGRLHFVLEMEHITYIAAIFKEVKVIGLKAPEGHHELKPYLKYAYSVDWPKIQEGLAPSSKAVYSSVEHGPNPLWHNLPDLRFKASLKEMLHESIVLHITNQGKIHNHTLGRCNLLFRTVVDNGKAFKEENLITFKGNLKSDNATIEGTLYFKYIPKFAQMKSVSVLRKAIHTEKGIHDALPLLPGLPVPKLPILNSEVSVDDTHVKGKTGNDLFEEKVREMKEKEKQKVEKGEGSESQAKKEEGSAPPAKKEDPAPLISFDSPFSPRRNRAATMSNPRSALPPHMSVREIVGFDSFQSFGQPNPFGAPPPQANPFATQFSFGTPMAMQANPFGQGPQQFQPQQPQQVQQPQQPKQNPQDFNPFV